MVESPGKDLKPAVTDSLAAAHVAEYVYGRAGTVPRRDHGWAKLDNLR